MNIKKIYTANYEQEGYQQGFALGQKGEPKSAFGVLKTLHPLNYVWRFNTAMNSYSKGLNLGYTDSSRKDHLFTPFPHLTQGVPTMSTEHSYAAIIRTLEQQIREIERNITQLNHYLDHYRDQIHAMGNAGFNREYIDKLDSQFHLLVAEKEKMQRILQKLIDKLIENKNILIEIERRI